MSTELTEAGNMALRSLMHGLAKLAAPDAWDSAYARGQIAVIDVYMEPDPALLQQARLAVDKIAASMVPKAPATTVH